MLNTSIVCNPKTLPIYFNRIMLSKIEEIESNIGENNRKNTKEILKGYNSQKIQIIIRFSC